MTKKNKKQIKVLKAMYFSRKQNRIRSLEMFLKWRHLSPIFHCAVNFIDFNFSYVCKSLKKINAFFSSQEGSLWAGDSENSSDVEKIFLKILSLVKRVQGVAV